MIHTPAVPPPLPTSKRDRNNRIIVRFALMYGGVVLLLLMAFLVWRLRLHYKADDELERIRAEGFPTNSKELDAWYTGVPARENAAAIYAKAFDLKPDWDNSKLKVPASTGSLTNEYTEYIISIVQQNAEALSLLHKGSTLSRARYPVDLSAGSKSKLLHLKGVQTGAELLEFESITALTSNDNQTAVSSVAATLALGESLKEEPSVTSQLSNIRVTELSHRSLERIIGH